jgi:hypothetical protein
MLAEFRGWFELALLVQDRIDVRPLGIDDGFINHDENLDAEELSLFVPKSGARDRRSLFYTAQGRI